MMFQGEIKESTPQERVKERKHHLRHEVVEFWVRTTDDKSKPGDNELSPSINDFALFSLTLTCYIYVFSDFKWYMAHLK